MKKNFSELQIINILKEGESRIAVNELIEKHNIGRSTYYKWQSKYGEMNVSDAIRL